MQKIKYGLAGLAISVAAIGLHYALPRVSVVQIVGVEVKRVDGESGTRDVYHIQAQSLDGSSTRVFRNEDNYFYLKFNSADLQARAAAFVRQSEDTPVAIRHYGWRLPIISLFPNAVKAWPVDANYKHFPLFNIMVILSLTGAVLLASRKIRNLISKLKPAGNEGAKSASAGSAAGHSANNGFDADWFSSSKDLSGGSDAGSSGGGDA